MLEVIENRKQEFSRATQALCMCPKCLSITKMYVRTHGLDQWKLESQCMCGYTKNDYKWPFIQEPTFQAVKPEEFAHFGVLLYTDQDPLNNGWYDDIDDEYNDEVAHGWERSHDDI